MKNTHTETDNQKWEGQVEGYHVQLWTVKPFDNIHVNIKMTDEQRSQMTIDEETRITDLAISGSGL